jgi:hypothetical protein
VSAPRTLAEELLAEFRAGGVSVETTFDLMSRGGYSRSVTGTIAYLDEEARTFMVQGRDSRLIRVPLREVASTHPSAMSDHAGGDGTERSLQRWP